MQHRHGFIRRTLLKSDEGEWAVLVDWETSEDAAASMEAFPNDPASAPFNAVIDPASFERPTFFKQIRKAALKQCQFPESMSDAVGSFQRPSEW